MTNPKSGEGLVAGTLRLTRDDWSALHRKAAEESLRLGKRVSTQDIIRKGIHLVTRPAGHRAAEAV
jgi:hypothetical protein